MKKVFKISGKFQQYGRWSELKDDFIGYFAKTDDRDVFTGYKVKVIVISVLIVLAILGVMLMNYI